MSFRKCASVFAITISCIFALNVLPIFSASRDAEKIDGTILAFTNTSQTHIEASIVCDTLTLRYKDGKTQKMSMRELNRKGSNDVTAMWNLFCFYIVKDIWRGVTHTDKVMGQANISLKITADGKHEVTRKAIYIPGSKPCIGAKAPLPPKVQAFWKQALECVEYIEFSQMKIPDSKVASVTLDIVFGRDLDTFPRYSFCNYQGLLKRVNGVIVRAKTIK